MDVVKTLQRRFVFAAMTAITGLILLLLGAINAANIVLVSARLDATLEMLAENRGDVRNLPPEKHGEPREAPFPFGLPEGGPNDYDTFMSSSYFVVRFDQQGRAVFVDVSRTSSVDEAEAISMASGAAQGSASGGQGRFRYLIRQEPGLGATAIFLDVSGESSAYLRVLLLSAAIGLGCWALMLLAVMLLARRAIAPIAENIRRQREFVTNAGHEIKTPLAIIQSNTEAMELYTGENKWSRNIKEQTRRLSGLAADLLLLARMDEGTTPSEPADLELSALASGVIEGFAQPIEDKSLRLSRELPQARIRGDRKQLRQLVSILLDNAVKYSNEGGSLSVSIEAKDGRTALRVSNTCAALPEDAPEKLFLRFYRGDYARTQKGGYGIGLSVAKSLAKVNGAEITASYTKPNIITFTIIFKRS